MPATQCVDQLRLVGPAGTNKVMAGELSRLAKRASIAQLLSTPKKQGLGTLIYPFDAQLAHVAVHYHRTSARVVWSLYSSTELRLEPLYAGLLPLVEQEQRPWLSQDMSISVTARGVEDFEAGERQVVGTVKNAIVEGAAAQGLRVRVDPAEPDVLLLVRMHEGTLTVSIDLAGRPMNQRGYRTATGPAPLRENLAAVMAMLARHDGKSEALLDPLAGSGTIPIEAASMARARPVWISPRAPACDRLAAFEAQTEAPRPLFGDTKPLCIANDEHPGAVAMCEQQIRRAGVEAFVQCRAGDFRDLDPDEVRQLCADRGFDPARGLILSNPPYGERLQNDQLWRLYEDLGDYCRRFRGWRAGFLVVNPDFERAFGGEPRIRKPLSNGPLRGYFLLYDL